MKAAIKQFQILPAKGHIGVYDCSDRIEDIPRPKGIYSITHIVVYVVDGGTIGSYGIENFTSNCLSDISDCLEETYVYDYIDMKLYKELLCGGILNRLTEEEIKEEIRDVIKQSGVRVQEEVLELLNK